VSDTTLRANEIFFSIQGESTWAGLPCVFVRLTGCHLRCAYCDTEYAFYEGDKASIEQVTQRVDAIGGGCRLVEITGGEPLLQPGAGPLTTALAEAGYTVLVETSGACDISACDARAIRIMDLKTPGSGEASRNDWANIDRLADRDEVKLVITDRADYDWAKDILAKHRLDKRVHAVLMSAAAPLAPTEQLDGTPGLEPKQLAEWILADNLPVRYQTQLHKHIWDPNARGV